MRARGFMVAEGRYYKQKVSYAKRLHAKVTKENKRQVTYLPELTNTGE